METFDTIKYKEILRKTPKAILIVVQDRVAWLPLSRIQLDEKRSKVEVPTWLFERIEWKENTHDINYVASADDKKSTKEKSLEDSIPDDAIISEANDDFDCPF